VAASYSPSDCVLGASSTRCACGGHRSQHEPPENDESRFITATAVCKVYRGTRCVGGGVRVRPYRRLG
jgi:hypothetical protein